MANNQLALYKTLTFGGITEQDIITIRETIAKDCNESQFKLFMGIAKSLDANPILGEIHPTVYQGKLTPQYGIDLFVRKAKETEGYRGYDVQLVHENDTFKMHQERADDGRYYAVIDEHSWGFPRGKVIGGYAMAYKEGIPPFTVTMDVEEVDHYKRSAIGMQKTMWTNNFNDMFKKHMLKRALKAAFGLKIDETDFKNDSEFSSYEPVRRDITAEVVESSPEVNKNASSSDEEQQVREKIKEAFKALGIKGKQAQAEYMRSRMNQKGDKPTLQELTGLLKIMELEIEEQQDIAGIADGLGPLE